MNRKTTIVVAALILLAGCAGSDKLLRPEHVTYIPWSSSPQPVTISDGHAVQLSCLDSPKNGQSSSGTVENDRCMYYGVDESGIFNKFGSSNKSSADLTTLRNSHVSFLLNISDHNCTTFLNRAFASKSGVDTTSRTFNDILTGLSAATANAQPHAAAGLSVANLVIGKTVDNVNSTYYFEKTFQALAASIHAERNGIKTELKKNLTDDIGKFTIYDALAVVHKYDNACSIRVGLEKLQGIAQDAANKTEIIERNEKEIVQKNSLIASLTTTLTQNANLLTETLNTGKDGKLAPLFDKLVKSKDEVSRKSTIAEIENILKSTQNNANSIETLANTLKETTLVTRMAPEPPNATQSTGANQP